MSQALLLTCRLGKLQQRHNAYVSVSSRAFPRSAPSSCFLTSLSCMWSRTLRSGEKPQGYRNPQGRQHIRGVSSHGVSAANLPRRRGWHVCFLTAPILQRNLRHMSSKHPCSKVAAGLSRNVSGLDVAHLGQNNHNPASSEALPSRHTYGVTDFVTYWPPVLLVRVARRTTGLDKCVWPVLPCDHHLARRGVSFAAPASFQLSPVINPNIPLRSARVAVAVVVRVGLRQHARAQAVSYGRQDQGLASGTASITRLSHISPHRRGRLPPPFRRPAYTGERLRSKGADQPVPFTQHTINKNRPLILDPAVVLARNVLSLVPQGSRFCGRMESQSCYPDKQGGQ